MRRLRDHVASTVSCLVLIIVLVTTFSNFATAQRPAENVVVTNTPQQAVPTTIVQSVASPIPTSAQGTTVVAGDVSIVNTPTVLATQSGTWNVNVANTSPIPVAIGGSSNEPFQRVMEGMFQVNEFGATTSFNVPSGKRLVMEFASVDVDTGSAQATLQVMESQILTGFAGFGAVTGSALLESRTILLYAGPGATVTCVGRRFDRQAAQPFRCNVTGHLVDVP